ncbi:MBL fold metallo-hydrolase [Brevundimonas olei]|uniref:MBL fold metallo-hydrolase n=1 Tax=Brevundimonas olei TaxID=657642 RepID=UPI0031D42C44
MGAGMLPGPGQTFSSGYEGLRVQRLAWAGVRLQLPTQALFIDPLADHEIWGAALPDALVPVDVSYGETERVVLVTHTHSDHCDPRAIASALARGGTLAFAEGAVRPANLPAGIRLRACPLWEPQMFGDFTATPVPAVDGYGDLQASWVVSAAGRRIFHGGDTMMHGAWWRIGRQFGGFDAAFMPINGAAFSFIQPATEASAVLTPEQAMDAAAILGAERLVPIHYGIRGADQYSEVSDPMGRLSRAVSGGGPKIVVLQPGEWLDWNEPVRS